MLAKIKYRFFAKTSDNKEAPWESGTLLGFATISRKDLVNNGLPTEWKDGKPINGQDYDVLVLSQEQDLVMAMVAKDSDGHIVSIPHYYCKLNDEEG